MTMEPPEKQVYIEKETIKRLLYDIKDLVKSPLTTEGIYYKHSDDDILTGYALIIGPQNTPYYGGFYFFKFQFPSNYPYSPPIVSYLTNDGVVRYHPNFYINKKVCLSILNTWRGEQWTSCQSIRSVLITIWSVMDESPLLHEPGIYSTHPDYASYNNIIYYKNIDFCILTLLTKFETYFPDWPDALREHFKTIMKTEFYNKKDGILSYINEKAKTIKKHNESVSLYNRFITTIDYADLLKRIHNYIDAEMPSKN